MSGSTDTDSKNNDDSQLRLTKNKSLVVQTSENKLEPSLLLQKSTDYVLQEEQNSQDLLTDNAAFERKYSEISQFCLANIEQAQNARLGKAKGGSAYKAYSVCGTPQYMSPEVIAQQGHDMGVPIECAE